MRVRSVVAAGVVVTSLLAAFIAPRPPVGRTWPGTEIVVAASSPTRTLLGGTRGGRPVIWVDGTELPLRGISGYSAGAVWQSVAIDGDRVIAIGGERGGAHGNVRWTVWAGTTSGLLEEPQPFETFGGWGMGQLVAAAHVAGEPVIVGTWQSHGAGFDIAVWRRTGPGVWGREPADPVTSSTPTSLVEPADATGAAGRLVVVGRTYDLSADQVRPAAWLRTDGGWSAVALPIHARTAFADSVSCDDKGCLVGGQADGRLAAWSLGYDGRASRLTLPDAAPNPYTRVLAVREPATLVATVDGRPVIIAQRAGAWGYRAEPMPSPGRAVAAVRTTTGLLLVTTLDSRSTVWTLPT